MQCDGSFLTDYPRFIDGKHIDNLFGEEMDFKKGIFLTAITKRTKLNQLYGSACETGISRYYAVEERTCDR